MSIRPHIVEWIVFPLFLAIGIAVLVLDSLFPDATRRWLGEDS